MSLFKEFVLSDPPSTPNVALVAVPGTLTLGRHVIDRVMDLTKAVEFSKCVPQFLPDVLLGEEDGRPYVPGIDLYKSTRGKPDLLIVTSNFQVGLSPSPHSYWLAEYIVRKVREASSERILVLDSVIKDQEGQTGIFYVANSKTSAKWAKSVGLRPLQLRRIGGLSSLVVPISRLYKLEALGVVSVIGDATKAASHVNRVFGALVRLIDLQVP